MFVGVNVRDVNSGRLYLANLGGSFGFDLLWIDPPGEGAGGEGLKAVSKTRCSRVGGGESWNCLRRKHGLAVDEYDVAADTQIRDSVCQLHGFGEGGSVGHERGGSYDPIGVCLDDGAIHATGESEIIGIDDQAPHRASLAGRTRGATVQFVR